jgi:hypothetical protein
MSKFIKVFFGAGVPFALISAVFFCLQFGLYPGLKAGAASGIGFGFIMASVLFLINRFFGNKDNVSEKDKGVKQKAEIAVALSYEKVFELCLKSLEKIKKCEIKEADPSKGIISAQTGTTWKTWGDIISFEIKNDADNNKTSVIVSSCPAVSTTLVDFGKNYENVRIITSFLKENSLETDRK